MTILYNHVGPPASCDMSGGGAPAAKSGAAVEYRNWTLAPNGFKRRAMLKKVVDVEPPIEMIVERIVETFHPDRVVLFGSRARGNPRPDSDVDLLVVMESSLSRAARAAEVHRLFAIRLWSMDVFVYTPEEARIARGWRNSLVTIAEREGRVLYDKPG